jgi:hypothetical protein
MSEDDRYLVRTLVEERDALRAALNRAEFKNKHLEQVMVLCAEKLRAIDNAEPLEVARWLEDLCRPTGLDA